MTTRTESRRLFGAGFYLTDGVHGPVARSTTCPTRAAGRPAGRARCSARSRRARAGVRRDRRLRPAARRGRGVRPQAGGRRGARWSCGGSPTRSTGSSTWSASGTGLCRRGARWRHGSLPGLRSRLRSVDEAPARLRPAPLRRTTGSRRGGRPGSRSDSSIPRRTAHWVHTVTRPPATTAASRSASGVACGRANACARPGTPNHAASPVSHSDTSAPAATAVAATVKPWLQRSGSSAPAVTFTTSGRTSAQLEHGRPP